MIQESSPLFVFWIQILDDFKNGSTEDFIKETNKTIHECTGTLKRKKNRSMCSINWLLLMKNHLLISALLPTYTVLGSCQIYKIS